MKMPPLPQQQQTTNDDNDSLLNDIELGFNDHAGDMPTAQDINTTQQDFGTPEETEDIPIWNPTAEHITSTPTPVNETINTDQPMDDVPPHSNEQPTIPSTPTHGIQQMDFDSATKRKRI